MPTSTSSAPDDSSRNSDRDNPTSTSWISRFLKFRRRAKRVEVVSPSSSDYRAQDRVGYNLDGTYSHGKPEGGETQFGIDSRVPAPAFGMTTAAVAGYMLHGRIAAVVGESLESVREHGARLFDSRYAQIKALFEGRIVAAQRLIGPLEMERETILLEAKTLSPVIKNEKDKYTIPTDWRLLALVVVVGLWGCVAYSEWINAAARQLPLVQDWAKAKAATVPWLAVGIVIEWLIVSNIGAAGAVWRKVWRIASLISIPLYAVLYAVRFGASADADVASTIASAMSGGEIANNGKSLDQALYFGQLFFGIVCGAALLEAALHLMVGRDVVVSNPDRQRLQTEGRVMTEQINREDSPLHKARGHLVEFEACRAAFIDYGVRAYQTVAAEKQLLDRERELIERQRRLLLG
jgi:hypothetical protein